MKTPLSNPIIFHEQIGPTGTLGIVTLNTPKKLHATRLLMTQLLQVKLHEWAQRADIGAVLIQAPLEKAFCAGGDLNALYYGDTEYAHETFWDEYRLVALLAQYPKPTIALTQGYTMGGGVGLSIYTTYTVAAPHLQWAMPETSIGFFPDVGASYFLPMAPRHIGRYLGLTGTTISAYDAQICGFVDYIVPFTAYRCLIDDIANSDYRTATIENLLDQYTIVSTTGMLTKHIDQIDRHFHATDSRDIIASLHTDPSPWAQQTLIQLQQRSPLSLAITATLLSHATYASLEVALTTEYQLACNVYAQGDFIEGIRAKIIDKDRSPNWRYKHIEAIPEKVILAYFDATQPPLTFQQSDRFIKQKG